MNISWSIDLGGILTLLFAIGGFIILIVRRSGDIDTLKSTVEDMAEELSKMRITVVRLEERVSTLLKRGTPPNQP